MKLVLQVALVSTFISGCAQQQYSWVAPVGAEASTSQVMARCDYEATAATQGTDYSFRTGLGQELDRAMRKQDLLERCMKANGFQQVPLAGASTRSTQSSFDAIQQQLGPELRQAKSDRAALRARLTAQPSAPESAEWRNEIGRANQRIADLERKLGHLPTPPLSTD